MKALYKLSFFALLTLLTSCSTGRYQQANDSTPTRLPNQAELKDATPRAENYSRGGNKNYKVRGINYQVLTHAQNFEEIGTASWYGRKFHGHLTSNGEIYDMYSMSAAHKNLPLPTYLKVTNLTNNKSVIVRVNDRGPFHQKRIIDLSYSAAYKLDMLKTGTAQVKITSITNFNKTTPRKKPLVVNIKKPATNSQLNVPITKNYIQVFATSKLELAKKTAKFLSNKYSQAVNYPKENSIYRIQIGPVLDDAVINKLLRELKQGSYPNAYLRSL
ncbi:septal ring lytic transglycosylase RlpA family protein [Candidatus Colwellia aromaticivorans]|uniref:septal ring lytic transglycosylase RlpA family protein n=1 Tax=Candidatus Colwellia aromaticivorans TaxID=2267621 RepID=UPI000DF2E4A0|nr:septal ring lytic transglycosylase RlpA family protein [Candidatus Colwellia aromaticivorans]